MYAVFQITYISCYNMDNTALHLAHNNFEKNAKNGFSECVQNASFPLYCALAWYPPD